MASRKCSSLLILLPLLVTNCCFAAEETKSQPIKIQVLNPDGTPAVGVKIGQLLYNTDIDNPVESLHMILYGDQRIDDEKPLNYPQTDPKGSVTISRSMLFSSGDDRQRVVFAASDNHTLMGFETLSPKDNFSQFTIELQQTVPVEVVPNCETLKKLGRSLHGSILYVYHSGIPIFELQTDQPSHHTRLPPGSYELRSYSGGTYTTIFDLEVKGEEKSIRKTVELTPTKIAMLIGKPAPEFEQIKDWYGSEPITLESLRGKVVILDFWGHWCGPCVYSMPKFFDLLEKYGDDGLVVIGIHDDSIKNAKELKEKLVSIRKEVWDGKDLPYPTAIDGGGEIEVPGRHASVRGATTAAYGITSWPTYLLIDRKGILQGTFYPRTEKDIQRLEKLLGIQDNDERLKPLDSTKTD